MIKPSAAMLCGVGGKTPDPGFFRALQSERARDWSGHPALVACPRMQRVAYVCLK